MRVTGYGVLHAPPERVWRALTDPAVLARAIPGCQRLAAAGPDAYRLTLQAAAPVVQGSYAGEVRVAERHPPTSLVLHVEGAGATGTVQAQVTVRLQADGSDATRVDYAADAVVGGAVAGVGQRLLAAAAQRMAGELLEAVDAALAAAPPAAEPAGARAGAGLPVEA
ncbi:MAG: SRPBCC domain-containing protein, partial [Actinomycetota bacterium]